MHLALESIKNELEQLGASLSNSMPNNEPLSVAHGNWSFPGIGREELLQEATSIIELIEARGGDELKANVALLESYPGRLNYLRANTVPQLWGGNAAAAVSCYLMTLWSLRKILESALGAAETDALDAAKKLKRLTVQLRALEARLSDLEPRSGRLAEMVERIEHAHEAADQLPTDLEALNESRGQIQKLLHDSNHDRVLIESVLMEVRQHRKQLDENAREASAIIERCDDAYRSTTSQGLASAFAERSTALGNSMWIWVGGLIIALVLGATLGSHQLQNLADVLKASSIQHDGTVWVNLVLSLLSIGAPVWFAWISTKQIGQRFRLAEDYGYKASISKAYEGYRREAALLDSDFQSRLFSSALTRLDEQPLRLVETATHGSPWHELASSDVVRQAVGSVPGFVGQVTDLAKGAISTLSTTKKTSLPVQPAAATADKGEDN